MPRVLTTTLLAVGLLLVGYSHLPGGTKTVNVEALDTAVGVRFSDPLNPATHGTVRVARVDVLYIDGSRSALNVRLGDAEGLMAIAQALQRAFGPAPHGAGGAALVPRGDGAGAVDRRGGWLYLRHHAAGSGAPGAPKAAL
jgi:hypothetical protein